MQALQRIYCIIYIEEVNRHYNVNRSYITIYSNTRLLSFIDDFEDWSHETEIWQCFTDLDNNKQAPAIYFSLDENIRKICCDMKVKDLNSDDGFDILLCKLKSLFAKDINQAAIIARGKFEMFKRPANMNIADFINEFERLYYKKI